MELEAQMRRSPVVLTAGMMLLASGLAGGQGVKPSPGLPESLRTHLRGERFAPLTRLADLPGEVREGLKALFRSPTLAIAEPGAEFQATDAIMKPDLPARRLILAGCSADHCLVYYERGGVAHLRYVVLYQ